LQIPHILNAKCEGLTVIKESELRAAVFIIQRTTGVNGNCISKIIFVVKIGEFIFQQQKCAVYNLSGFHKILIILYPCLV
jgi:hypothetical protein